MAISCDPDAKTIIAFNISLGFAAQGQPLWGVDVGTGGRLAIDQPVQQVQHMRFRCHARVQCHFHSPANHLFVMVQNERKDIDHFTITAGAAKHLVLQLPKGRWQFQEGRTVPQGTRLALDNGKAMLPVVNRARPHRGCVQ